MMSSKEMEMDSCCFPSNVASLLGSVFFSSAAVVTASPVEKTSVVRAASQSKPHSVFAKSVSV